MLTRKVTRAIPRMKDEYGGVMISFAVLLPVLIVLIAFGLNSLKMFIAKSKLGDVSAEIGLMVSANSTVTQGSEPSASMKKMLVNYAKEFFPESTKSPTLSGTTSTVGNDADKNAAFMTYQPIIKVELPFLFYHRSLSEDKKNFTVSSSAITVTKKVSRPVDIVFVVDFSTSQQGAGIRLLKQTFKELTEFILKSNPDSKVAMVPFSTGVAVKYPETNQRGGPKAGCSVLFVPKKGWDIDYSFWGDKYINGRYKNINQQTYYMDTYRYKYYSNNVRQSRPALPLQTTLDKWCRKNDSKGGEKVGHDTYSCFDNRFKEQDILGNTFYSDDIFSKKSLQIITNEYAKAVRLRDSQNYHFTIENIEAVDFPETLKKMFSDEAIITFPMLWTGMWDSNFRTFKEMCHNTGWWNNDGQLADAKLHSWLIELTNDAQELNQFQNMKAQGWTATSSGLVRSVPVMMKGRNPRKIFVIMSDGDDSTGPQKVTDRYLKDYKLCDKIKDGILERPETNAERVDIYYVSTTNSTKRVNYWRDYCTGEGNAAKALNRKQVVDLIKGFLSDEIGSFTQ